MPSFRSVLVIGGARSGKSRIAQGLAERSGVQRVLIATAQGLDDEMRDRIARHRAERDATWRIREEPLALAETIAAETAPDRVVLVDCLTLWLSNVVLSDADAENAAASLTRAVADAKGPLVLVSNEVGHGIVPETPLGRLFRDEQGRLNQRIAAACDAVVAVTAGCPVLVKPAPALDLSLA